MVTDTIKHEKVVGAVFFQADEGIRDVQRSGELGDEYKEQRPQRRLRGGRA